MASEKPWYRKSVAELMGKEKPPAKSFAGFQAEANEKLSERRETIETEQPEQPPDTAPQVHGGLLGPATISGWMHAPTVARVAVGSRLWWRDTPDGLWFSKRLVAKIQGPLTTEQVRAEVGRQRGVLMGSFDSHGRIIHHQPYSGFGG